MATQSAIRLVFVGNAAGDSGELASLLRDAGHVGEYRAIDDPDALHAACAQGAADIIVHTLDNDPGIALQTSLDAAATADPALPVIAIGAQGADAGETLAVGAADLVTAGDHRHLCHAVLREFRHLHTGRELHRLREVWRESEQRANTLMKSSNDAIAYLHDGMHVLTNEAYLERFGYARDADVEGLSIMDLVEQQDRDRLKSFLRQFDAGETDHPSIKLHLQQADASTFEAEMEFCPATIDGESCQQVIIRDSADTEALERQLRELARRDPVTHLYNHQYFLELLEQAVIQAERADERTALLQVQVADFADIRRQVGVQGADRILSAVASKLQSFAGDHDHLARLESATFGMLMSQGDSKKLESLARRIRKAMRDHVFETGATSINLNVGIGIAVIDRTVGETSDALHRSEQALLQALSRGGDAHLLYVPRAGELSQKQRDAQWVDRIRQLLRDERFRILFQPIVSVHGDTTERFRAQLNVLDDKDDLYSDPELFAAASRTGMSRGIDRWTVLNALKVLVQQLRQNPNTVLFIPLSEHAFNDSDLVRWIHERVKSLNLPRGAIVFETSAAGAASRVKRAAAFAGAMHDLGYEFCLDRFGHGKDPFQLTNHVPVDYLRLHEIFVQDITRSTDNRKAVSALARQAREAGIRTISPGVSDAASLSAIWTLGTDLVEGDFLQKPTREPDYDFSTMAG